MPPVPERGRRQSFRKERLVDGAPDEIDEEPKPEHAEDNRGHASQVVDPDAHQAHEEALFRVLPQVQGRQHTKGDSQQAHEEHHHHRAEDRRKDPALRVRFPWIAGEKFPQPAGIHLQPAGERQLIGPERAEDIDRGEFLLRAVDRRQRDACAGGPLGDLAQARLGLRILLFERRQALLCFGSRGGHVDTGSPRGPHFEGAQVQSLLFNGAVDRADLASFEPLNLAAVLFPLLEHGLEPLPHGVRPSRQLLFPFHETDRRTNERAVLPALDVDGLGWLAAFPDRRFVNPSEVRPEDVAIPKLHLDAKRRRLSRGTVRNWFPGDKLAEHGRSVNERQPGQRPRPERPQTVDEDEADHRGDHQQADPQSGAGKPDRRIASPQKLTESHQRAR